MPRFSKKSASRLETCEVDLQIVAHEAIKYVDFSVRYGARLPEEQFELFKSGRILKGGIWILVKPELWKTNCDGYKIISDHNHIPSRAMDLYPYPWPKDPKKKIYEFYYLNGVIMGLAARLFDEGIIQNKIYTGLRWSKQDAPHYYIKKNLKSEGRS